jgi:hypothetical protein
MSHSPTRSARNSGSLVALKRLIGCAERSNRESACACVAKAMWPELARLSIPHS